jgi:hypothetical protein
MENNQTQPTLQIQSKQKGLKKILVIIGALLLAAGASYGVYVWQQDQATKKQQSLQSQIDTLKVQAKDTSLQVPIANFTYNSKIGGLKLTLSKTYPVIVNVDGNKGGAPGATLRVGKQVSEGIIEDSVYEWVEINIDQNSGTLQKAVDIKSAELKDATFSNIRVTDSKFANQPAKLITATGVSYDAQRRIYLMQSGDFTYMVTSKMQDASQDNEILKAVLAGISIQVKKLN